MLAEKECDILKLRSEIRMISFDRKKFELQIQNMSREAEKFQKENKFLAERIKTLESQQSLQMLNTSKSKSPIEMELYN